MKYIVHQLGRIEKGNVVEVSLKGNAANVLLLDSSNYNNYKNGSEINCKDEFTATGNKQHSNNTATREKQRMWSA